MAIKFSLAIFVLAWRFSIFVFDTLWSSNSFEIESWPRFKDVDSLRQFLGLATTELLTLSSLFNSINSFSRIPFLSITDSSWVFSFWICLFLSYHSVYHNSTNTIIKDISIWIVLRQDSGLETLSICFPSSWLKFVWIIKSILDKSACIAFF